MAWQQFGTLTIAQPRSDRFYACAQHALRRVAEQCETDPGGTIEHPPMQYIRPAILEIIQERGEATTDELQEALHLQRGPLDKQLATMRRGGSIVVLRRTPVTIRGRTVLINVWGVGQRPRRRRIGPEPKSWGEARNVRERILRLLESVSGVNCEQLAEAMAVSVRRVRRAVYALDKAGRVTGESKGGREKYYRLAEAH